MYSSKWEKPHRTTTGNSEKNIGNVTKIASTDDDSTLNKHELQKHSQQLKQATAYTISLHIEFALSPTLVHTQIQTHVCGCACTHTHTHTQWNHDLTSEAICSYSSIIFSFSRLTLSTLPIRLAAVSAWAELEKAW